MNSHCATLVVAVVVTLAVNGRISAQAIAPVEYQPSSMVSASLADSPTLGCDDHKGGVPGLSTCCCEELDVCSLWSVTADALFLNRRNPAAIVLAFNTVNPAENLNASDFKFNVHAGYDLSVAHQLSSDNLLELRYFDVNQWNTGVTEATTPNNLFRVNAAVPVFTFTGDAIQARYASKLNNAEINGRHHVNGWLDLLAGFRYTELDEHGAANLVNSAVPFDYNVATRNRLYGFQLGSQARLWSGDGGLFSVDAIGKAGIFANQAAQNGSYSTGLVTLPAIGRGNPTAFIGEVGVTGTCQLTEHLVLRGGYRLLWIDGVALASDQLSVSDFANNAGFNGTGDVFYHGAFAGLECTW